MAVIAGFQLNTDQTTAPQAEGALIPVMIPPGSLVLTRPLIQQSFLFQNTSAVGYAI